MGVLFLVSACLEDPGLKSNAENTAVDGSPVTRSQVVLTADGYAMAHWTMRQDNRTGVTCEGTFFSEYPLGDRVGVGYKWGGWTELDEYLDKVSRGWATGTGGGLTWETIHGMAMIIDSSSPGVRMRLVSWYVFDDDDYTAIRYNNIVDDPDPDGTAYNPVELPVGKHVVSVDGNTRDVVSLKYHGYSIAPSVREPGRSSICSIFRRKDFSRLQSPSSRKRV